MAFSTGNLHQIVQIMHNASFGGHSKLSFRLMNFETFLAPWITSPWSFTMNDQIVFIWKKEVGIEIMTNECHGAAFSFFIIFILSLSDFDIFKFQFWSFFTCIFISSKFWWWNQRGDFHAASVLVSIPSIIKLVFHDFMEPQKIRISVWWISSILQNTPLRRPQLLHALWSHLFLQLSTWSHLI